MSNNSMKTTQKQYCLISSPTCRYEVDEGVGGWQKIDCKPVPFFSPSQRTTQVHGRRLVRDVRPRGRGTGEKGGKSVTL